MLDVLSLNIIVIVIVVILPVAILIVLVNQVFIYTDMKTAISGTFSKDGRLVEGCECEVVQRMMALS